MLVETVAGRQTVAHASAEVPPAIRPGMGLAEAQAYHAGLLCLPATPDEDGRALVALARWLTRFSPGVSPCPPDAILLDVTGMERLYGGPGVVARLVSDALAALRLDAALAVAPTPGAAWALARFAGGSCSGVHDRAGVVHDRTCVVHDRAGILRAVGPLPAGALRLDGAIVATLRSLGVTTIADLLRLPRGQLTVRFGADVLRRIDQLTGDVAEPLAFLEHRTPVTASVAFEGAASGLEMIHAALQQLVIDVCATLAERGLGARELQVTLPRPYAPAIERTIRAARPSRSVAGLFELIRCSLETMRDDRGDGFIGARLHVAHSERLADAQATLAGDDVRRADDELDHLVERLHARFDACLAWPAMVESRMPERAMTCAAAPPRCGPSAGAVPVRPWSGARPTRLLRDPEELRVIVTPSESLDGLPVSMTRRGQVRRLSRARGPERLVGDWWDGRGKTRDYFDAEDEAGRRYWLFRVVESGRWFLHGLFE